MAGPFVILLAALAAQPTVSANTQQLQDHSRTFISPMGEPFRSRGAGDDTLADWFAHADGNHDGSLTLAEFTSDAEHYFATVDANHDGTIDGFEIRHYETVLAPEVQDNWSPHQANAGYDFGGSKRHRGRFRDDPYHGLEGAGRFGLLNIPEPVAAADLDVDGKVTRAEFSSAASDRFQLLDSDHDGRLTLAELEAERPVIGFPNRRPAGGSGERGR